MEALAVSLLAVALSEFGDKTQLLALLLAARFQKPLPIVAGILVATVANHTLAALLGAWIAQAVAPDVMRWMLGLSFIAIALWTLKPDTIEEQSQPTGHYGVFMLTVVAFFLAEIGDKTQLATVALAAKYQSLLPVIAGTTCGMLIADAPAVWLGNAGAQRLPLRAIRGLASVLFALIGVAVLAEWSI
jgi:putative Ca2+/H+ antiporter (TMEM165/GDT1 family)